MNDLFKMIYRQFAAYRGDTDPYTLLGGRLYRTLAPPQVTAPYAVMSLVSGPIDWIFGDKAIERARIQFDVYGRITRTGSPTAPMDVWAGLIRILENKTLYTLDGAQFLTMRRESLPRELVEDPYVRITGDWWCERQVAGTQPQ